MGASVIHDFAYGFYIKIKVELAFKDKVKKYTPTYRDVPVQIETV